MKSNDKGYWQALCNALHLISKFYKDHKHIENNVVEIMDEIEGIWIVVCNLNPLNYMLKTEELT